MSGSVMMEYRVVNADYAVVGLEAEIGEMGRRLADELAARGIRMGVVTLRSPEELAGDVLDLWLGAVNALTVVEPARREGLTERVRLALGTHGDWPWADWAGRQPVYCVTHEGSLTADALRRAVQSMLTYGERHLHVACAA